MKIQQEQPEFKATTITLEQRWEAEAFFSIMDKICACWASEDRDIKPNHLTKQERDIAIKLSDALTDRKVII